MAVAPSISNDSQIASGKKCAVLRSFFSVIILLLMFVGKACNAFNNPPSSSKTLVPTKTKSPISNVMISKAIMVEQEQQDEGHPQGDSNEFHSNAHSDQARTPHSIKTIDVFLLDWLEDCYAYSERHMKCPFFRRRCGDILDDLEAFVRFFLVRPHFRNSTPHLGPRLSCKPVMGKRTKTKNMSICEILQVLQKDWRSLPQTDGEAIDPIITPNEKGYYVTGKISTAIYRDDCKFTSPDPDLPIQGLRKYVGVASHLFDSKASHSKLLSLRQVLVSEQLLIKAEWKMSLTLNLPWKPQLSEFTGSTLYFLDEDHLICRHDEAWDISVWDAFLGMLPKKGNYNLYHNKVKKLKCPLAVLSSWFSPHHESSSSDNSKEAKVPTD